MKKKKYSMWNNIFFFYQQLYQYDRIVFYKQILYVVCAVILPLFSIYLPKLMLDCVEKKTEPAMLFLVLGGFVLLMALGEGIAVGIKSGTYLDRNFSRNFLMAALFRKFRRVPYRYTEDGDYLNMYNSGIANVTEGGDMSAPSVVYYELPKLIIRIFCFFAYSAVIVTMNPLILLMLVLFSAVRYWMKEQERSYMDKRRPEQDTLFRRIRSVRNAAENAAAAKDIRIFGLRGWLGEQNSFLLEQSRKINRDIQRRTILQENGGYLLEFVRNAVVYGWLILQAAEGQMTAGDFMLYLGAVTGFGDFLNQIVSSWQELLLASDKTQVFRQYLDIPDEEETEGERKTSADLQEKLSIDFEHVHFSYEENGKKIFDDFSLHIKAGEKIALVGENGAGKSTLVKLLTGLYQPQAGCIRIGGVDIKELSVKERYRLFSAVFQETAYFPFTVGENLTLQTADKVDEKKAWKALEQAGIADRLRQRKISLSDYMTKYYLQDGIELSGGEMQRFMMARALYKDGPILLLDEPTAALDPIAENEIYQTYAQITQNKTAIFISHRLASTRFSDRIVFIRDGRIAESGTHEELMKNKGAYAKMFELQASYYVEGGVS